MLFNFYLFANVLDFHISSSSPLCSEKILPVVSVLVTLFETLFLLCGECWRVLVRTEKGRAACALTRVLGLPSVTPKALGVPQGVCLVCCSAPC